MNCEQVWLTPEGNVIRVKCPAKNGWEDVLEGLSERDLNESSR